MVAGIFTVLGVLLAQLSSFLLDRRRSKREDRQRWDERIHQQCAEVFVQAGNTWKAVRLMDSSGNPSGWPDFDPLHDAVAVLVFAAPKPIVDAAFALSESVWNFCYDVDNTNPREVSAGMDQYKRAEESFVDAARIHLRVDPLFAHTKRVKPLDVLRGA